MLSVPGSAASRPCALLSLSFYLLPAMGSNRNLPRVSDGSVILSSLCFAMLIASLESLLTDAPCYGTHAGLHSSSKTSSDRSHLFVSYHSPRLRRSASSLSSITKIFSSHYYLKRAARFWFWLSIPAVAFYFTTPLSTRLHQTNPLLSTHGLILGTCSGSVTVWCTFW